ncbi:MAG: Arm DNA-binding domain-containing protein [Desulfovibrio sp.]|jgi:hypothetical protein|nr:Arm DNA-binding domain-containing protein [Desulfovibrio sp.]
MELYLETSKAGGKYWRWKYTFEGKEKRLTFGAWPEVSLKEARDKRDDARKVLRNGVDPGNQNRKRVVAYTQQGRTFEGVAREWVAGRAEVWAQRHTETVVDRLVANVYPAIMGRHYGWTRTGASSTCGLALMPCGTLLPKVRTDGTGRLPLVRAWPL